MKGLLGRTVLCVWGLFTAAPISPLGAQSLSDGWLGDDFQWQTAGGRYLDPTSFFSLHGYVNGVFASESPDWTSSDPGNLPPPGQLLVPNTNHSSFQYDAALFVGAELDDRAEVMIEAHFVTDPSGGGAAGPGGLTVALTEATASYAFVRDHLRVSAGLFWAPFGNVNLDWLGGQNLFGLIPQAAGAFPVHYNERGVRADGAFRFGPDSGFNYVVSIGNGVSGFSIADQPGYDANGDRTTIGRIGLFPGFGRALEIGLSGATGVLRSTSDPTLPLEDVARYPGQLRALGLDAEARVGSFSARGYWIHSEERLDPVGAVTPDDIGRSGFSTEVRYTLGDLPLPSSLTALIPRMRFDWLKTDELGDIGERVGSPSSRTISLGLSASASTHFQIGAEYHFRAELDRAPLDNDRWVLRITGQF